MRFEKKPHRGWFRAEAVVDGRTYVAERKIGVKKYSLATVVRWLSGRVTFHFHRSIRTAEEFAQDLTSRARGTVELQLVDVSTRVEGEMPPERAALRPLLGARASFTRRQYYWRQAFERACDPGYPSAYLDVVALQTALLVTSAKKLAVHEEVHAETWGKPRGQRDPLP